MENMFGKSYNTIGNSNSNFIIKTKGDLKVQWGNKFIDLIKNGRIASTDSLLLEIVDSQDDINSNGIFLIPAEENYEVWISIDGTKVNLTNTNSYVSFLEELPEVTSDLKYIALKNIGFYYDSLNAVKQSNVTKGLIYNLQDNTLYVINNGQITPYIGSLNINNKFSELMVDTLKIAKDKAIISISNNSDIEFKIDSNPIITIKRDGVLLHKELRGESFRLYFKGGESYLEVDNISWKNLGIISGESSFNNSIWFKPENYIYPLKEGFAFKYQNSYKVGDSFYVLLTDPVTISYVDNTYTLNHTIPVDMILQTVSGKTVTIPKNTLKSEFVESEESYVVILGKQYLSNFSNIYIITISSLESEVAKFTPLDLKITEAPVRLINNPMLVIGEDISLIENSRVVTKIGNIENIEQLKTPSDSGALTSGIFSENLVSLNLQIYDCIFKKLSKFPEYDKDIKIPEDKEDKKYDKIVPNLEWIRQLLVPVGSIIMYSGTTIPKGWALCDGTNGTPNLIGRFIKAGTQVGEVASSLNENNELVLTDKNIPKLEIIITGSTDSESISLTSTDTFDYLLSKTVTKVAEGTAVDVIDSVSADYINVTVSGEHSHNINLSTTIGLQSPLPIKIEPRAYSLMFIMKMKNE